MSADITQLPPCCALLEGSSYKNNRPKETRETGGGGRCPVLGVNDPCSDHEKDRSLAGAFSLSLSLSLSGCDAAVRF